MQNSNPVKPKLFNEEWARIHAELKIPYGKASNRTPYTFRHTRAAELLTNGVPPAKGAEQLGNSVQVFLATYAEWLESILRWIMLFWREKLILKGTQKGHTTRFQGL